MRLTCPNCGAQYEVPEDIIPPEGRDVQCSNCGDTWYQLSAKALAAEQVQPPHEPTTKAKGTASEPLKRNIDPQVSQILREEAEREAALRAARGEHLETQTEMGLEDSFESQPDGKSTSPPVSAQEAPVVSQAPEKQSQPSGAVQVADPAEHAAVATAVQGLMQSKETTRKAAPEKSATPPRRSASRRDLLPDIEDVTQDLSDEDAVAQSQPPEALEVAPQRSRGFRSGFVFMLLLMGIAVFVYAQAPEIAGVLPDADAALTTYVTWVDDLRLWLDELVRGLSTEV